MKRIPSKALLQSSENFEHAGHQFAEHGIQVKGLGVDLARMLARKDKVFAKQGLAIQTGVKITKVTANKTVTVDYTDSAGGR